MERFRVVRGQPFTPHNMDGPTPIFGPSPTDEELAQARWRSIAVDDPWHDAFGET